MGVAEASTLLDLSLQAMEDTQDQGLQPADMVSLVQLLSLAADLPTEQLGDSTNHSRDDIQELGHHFLSVADSIISKENAFKWQAIKEVRVRACVRVCLVFCGHVSAHTKAGKFIDTRSTKVERQGVTSFCVGIASGVFARVLKVRGKRPADRLRNHDTTASLGDLSPTSWSPDTGLKPLSFARVRLFCRIFGLL